jgi:hypothetical protein
MEQSPFWEAYCCSAWLEISHIIWNPVVYYCAHRALLLGPTLRQMNPVQCNQCLDLTRGHFHSVFSPFNILCIPVLLRIYLNRNVGSKETFSLIHVAKKVVTPLIKKINITFKWRIICILVIISSKMVAM